MLQKQLRWCGVCVSPTALEKRKKKDLENPHQCARVSRDAGAPGSRAKRDPHAATPCAFARRPVQAHIGSRLGSHRRSGARPNTSPRWFRGAERNAETPPPSDVSVTWRDELSAPSTTPRARLPPAACRSVPRRASPRAPRSLDPAAHRPRIHTNRRPPIGHIPTNRPSSPARYPKLAST
jgi:hypothetical protein